MANPSGNGMNNDPAQSSHHHVHVDSPTQEALQHNPGISTDWTQEEQEILEDGLSKYASETNIIRYAKIAVQLPLKNVRDVAMRCRWMARRESFKRKKEDYSLTKRSKDRKDKMADVLASSSGSSTQSGFSSYVQGMLVNGQSNATFYSALESPTGQLLQQNAQALEQIYANLQTQQVHENISLFCQVGENILTILNNLNDMPEKMRHMPALPVKLKDELLHSILRPPAM